MKSELVLIDELTAERDRIMADLSRLSARAHAADKARPRQFPMELYYACNRAWHELDGAKPSRRRR